MQHAQVAGLTNRVPEMKFQEMMVAIRDSPCDLASSIDMEDGEEEDDVETEQGKLSEDDQPG
jgi:hypothetical protein